MIGGSSREWLARELTSFAAKLQPGALVLDAGAGDQRNAPKFHLQTYESADFEMVDKKYVRPTYSCDLANIPVEDHRFDAVVFTQVLEHLPEPKMVLKELHRVLKPGGKLFFTAPLWYQEHEIPYDFYRYTQYGLKLLFEGAGFEVLELRWLEGYLGSVAHQLRLMKKRLPRTSAGYGGGALGHLAAIAFSGLRFIIPALHWIARRSDGRFRYVGGGMPINYLAILIKREPARPVPGIRGVASLMADGLPVGSSALSQPICRSPGP
jgi:SAM-dependent methyltransferase